jgi:hypothetical protein
MAKAQEETEKLLKKSADDDERFSDACDHWNEFKKNIEVWSAYNLSNNNHRLDL